MTWKLWSLTFLLLALVSAKGLAHEGHDAAPGGGGGAIPGRHVLSALSDHYEVVLKNDALKPGLQTDLDVFLSDLATNAPVENVAVSLSLRSKDRELWSGAAAATPRPGIYSAPFRAPTDTGSYTVLIAVRGSAGEERLALSGLEVSAVGPSAGAAKAAGFPWVWVLAVALVLVIASWIVTSQRARSAGVAIVLGLILIAPASRAHEGHDDAPVASGAPVGPGAQVYAAKESQFLLGIRTEPLRRQSVQKRLSVLGRVAPRGGVETEIRAPQSGRIYFPEGRTPVLGQLAPKGQTLARLTVVDDLILRAPMSGVLTGVFVVNGQLVEAGQKLMTMLDPSVVWVHADVYEADVARVQRSTRALVTSQTMPEVSLEGRRVALGVTEGEVPGAIEAWFEVPNPGGRLRVGSLVDIGIEEGGADSAFVLPRSAVFEKDGRKLVFVHGAPERFTAREVMLGTSLGDRVVVTGELNLGDRIVVAGGYPLLTAPVVGLGP